MISLFFSGAFNDKGQPNLSYSNYFNHTISGGSYGAYVISTFNTFSVICTDDMAYTNTYAQRYTCSEMERAITPPETWRDALT